jgi:molecular chaperone DnaK
MTKIIPRNTTIPTKKSEVFSTAVDNQTNVEIHILQGEREMYKDNKSLGNFRLEGIPLAPRGVPQIEVTFDIDVNGILSVTAKDKSSGKEQSITIENASTLDKTEVEKMVEEAQRYADADKLKRDQIDLKNQAELLCYQSEKQLKELDGKISEQKTKEVQEIIIKIKETINLEDYDKLKIQVENLNKLITQISSDTLRNNETESSSSENKKDNVDDFIDVNAN